VFGSIEETRTTLAQASYFADEGLATSIFLALRMKKALFLEGEPGVGKTEVAAAGA
jgi:MoxR-like ATPase